MRSRLVLPVLTTLAVLAGCTSDPALPADAAGPSPGPLTVSADHPDGVELPPTDLFGYVVGVDDEAGPAVVWEDTADVSSAPVRIGVGPDPAGWVPVTPADVLSYQDVGTPAVADDGSLAALAVTRVEGVGSTVVVLRVAADGTVRTTPVPDVAFSRFEWSTVETVSDDGRTAVVTERVVDMDDLDGPTRIEVLSVDLTTATLNARTVIDLGVDTTLEGATDVAVGPDGAVTVLLGEYSTAAGRTGPQLVRLDPDLQTVGTVQLEDPDPVEPARLPQLALAPDGTAVLSVVEGDLLGSAGVRTRLLTVAPGSTDTEQVAELTGQLAPVAALPGNSLLTAIDDWAYLFLRGEGNGSTQLVPVDLATGEPAAAVPTCDRLVPEQLRRSGTGETVVAVVQCLDDAGDALLTLGTD